MNPLVSEDYRKLNVALHATSASYGTSGARWASLVKCVAISVKCNAILDYGCGKQTLKASLPEFNVVGYDPAIPELASKPHSHDFVVCTDVLEHIEPELLNNVLNNLVQVVGVVGLFVVSTRPAQKVLADGRNAHLIQKPPAFWLKRLGAKFNVLCFQFSERHAELFFLVTPKARTRPRKYLLSLMKTRLLRAHFPEIMSLLMEIWKMSWKGSNKITRKEPRQSANGNSLINGETPVTPNT
jgi:hypothetical protein